MSPPRHSGRQPQIAGPGAVALLPILIGLLVGALAGTWLASVVALRAGGYYSDEVLRTGRAEVGHCHTGLFLTSVCDATVTWADGAVEEGVRIESLNAPSMTAVPVSEHSHPQYRMANVWARTVVLVDGFPAGQQTGAASVAITASAIVMALVGGGAAGLVTGRILRQRPRAKTGK